MSPKLSDALRGMADRAPVGELEVSTHGAARRIRRHRTARMTANSLVGAGAVAVVAFAVIAPTTGGLPTGGGTDMAAAPDAVMEGLGAAEDARLAVNICGAPFSGGGVGDPATLAVTPPAEATIGGSLVPVDVTLTATQDFTGTKSAPALLVLWNGIVVGTSAGNASEPGALELATGDVVAETADLTLVNCWDGEALPGGSYQLAATQEILVTTEAGGDEVVSTDIKEPQGEPTEEGPVSDGATSASHDTPVYSFDVAYTLVSAPMTFENGGDVPDDPFGKYLNPPAPELPDGYLTPDKARELYQANVRDGAWDMAAGSQRVVMTSDGKTPDPNGTAWARNYFGCPWDGGSTGTFPARSADLDLVDVTAKLPGRVNLSYGWVVDGNPEVNFRVTNTSGFTLPALYEPNSSFLLVRDGRVVAEAYLSNAQRNGVDYNKAPEFFEAGASVGGTYLWREVSGCWIGNSQAEVAPGTYTVVNVQYFYLGNDTVVAYASGGGMEAAVDSQLRVDVAGGNEATIRVEPDLFPGIVAPAPAAEYDYVEFQVWTSLGTVTVTG